LGTKSWGEGEGKKPHSDQGLNGGGADYHTLQEVYGCNVATDGRFLHGHFRLTYYGYDYLTLNEDLSSWTAEGKGAEYMKNRWENMSEAERWKTYLRGECVQRLLRYLDLGKETLLRSGKRGP
jgi:major histocompatibility complex class I